MLARPATRGHFLKALQIFLLHSNDMDATKIAEFAPAHGQSVARNLDGMVGRVLLATAERFKDEARLFSRATAEFGYEHGRRQPGDDFVGMAGENASLGAGHAIFWKMADHFEQ